MSGTTRTAARTIRIATRTSPLALWQAEHISALLRAAGEERGVAIRTEIVPVVTTGDKRSGESLRAIGGRGVFAAEVREDVLADRADIAVHSAKDLPASAELQVDGLVIAAVPERGDCRDALVGARLDDLPAGALVATGSERRRAQLAWLRPDLRFTDLRGNIGTRLGKIPVGGAIVVAATALQRLGSEELIAEILSTTTMLPQVGQGALAVECREGDGELRDLLAEVDHTQSHDCLRAERAFLARLGGGCDLPVGALAAPAPGGGFALEGLIASSDGHVVLRRRKEGRQPEDLGTLLADELLDRCGGRPLLAAVT